MRYIVTGCAGFIGSHLTRELLNAGHDVIGIDNLSTGDKARVDEIKKKEYREAFTFCEMSVEEFQKANLILEIDGIFHLAAIPRVPVSFEKPQATLSNNYESTLSALEIARKAKCPVVYSSSSSVYGTQDTFPLMEDMHVRTESPYALSKYLGELLCQQYFQNFDVRYVALRYFNVYGEGMTKGGYATAISTFLEQKKAGKKLTVTGDGKQKRDFTHVSDVVSANILAMEELIGNCTPPFVLNIGAGRPVRIKDVAKMIGGEIEYIPARKEPNKTHADNTLARNVLGWRPKMNFKKGLKQLIESYDFKK